MAISQHLTHNIMRCVTCEDRPREKGGALIRLCGQSRSQRIRLVSTDCGMQFVAETGRNLMGGAGAAIP